MNSETIDIPVSVPSILERFPRPVTQERFALRPRKVALLSSLIAAPVVAGLLGGRSVRRGLIAGGVTALALGALRWQLARWFTPEPDYTVEGHVGRLELRRYPGRIDARSEFAARDIEAALHLGFDRLACFLFGGNTSREKLAMTTPVITTMREGHYETSFVMPPDRTLASLPHPDDDRVELHEVSPRRVAVLRFKGRFTRHNIEWRERDLLRGLVDAGLSAKGSVMFAAYDAPWTLPQLRRNELWIEIA